MAPAWPRDGEHDAAPGTVITLAHGSRDPRSAATMSLLTRRVAEAAGLDARLAFLDLSAPRLPEVAAAAHGDGASGAVVVPMLLGHAYHARVDVPAAVGLARQRVPQLSITTAAVLGPEPLLEAALLRRLREHGCQADDPDLGVLVVSAGSSAPAAIDALHAVAGRVAGHGRWRAAAAFATAAAPDVAAGVRQLRAMGASRVVMAPWFFADGLLLDRAMRAAAAEGATSAPAMGPAEGRDCPELVEVVLRRYRWCARPAAGSWTGSTDGRRAGCG